MKRCLSCGSLRPEGVPCPGCLVELGLVQPRVQWLSIGVVAGIVGTAMVVMMVTGALAVAASQSGPASVIPIDAPERVPVTTEDVEVVTQVPDRGEWELERQEWELERQEWELERQEQALERQEQALGRAARAAELEQRALREGADADLRALAAEAAAAAGAEDQARVEAQEVASAAAARAAQGQEAARMRAAEGADRARASAERAAARAEAARRVAEHARSGIGGTHKEGCEDLKGFENAALLGRLTAASIACLDARLEREQSDEISRILMVDAFSRGDVDSWERRARHHLTTFEPVDPDLAYKYALFLSKGARSDEVIRWSNAALARSEVWSGDTHGLRVYSLHKLRSSAAQKIWQGQEGLHATTPTPESAQRVQDARAQTLDFARQWLAFAKGAGKKVKTAHTLCMMAAGSSAACD